MRAKPDEKALRCQEYYDALMNALRYVAYRHGYALAVHGSLKRDIDLIACPWRDSAVNAQSLISALKETIIKIVGFAGHREGDVNPEAKPCGRLAWTIYLEHESRGNDSIYLDISVMPKVVEERIELKVKRVKNVRRP